MATVYGFATDEYFAKLPGVRAELRDTAEAGGARAEAILSAHRAQGHSRITVTKGSLDWFVSLDDTRGDRAAAAIEYGRSGGRGGATQGVFALAGAFR
ncbi:MAG: DUF5403 family protein [Pseudonocardia sp.]|nr:DUF5403 family protein [Pseudonocardia sp.]